MVGKSRPELVFGLIGPLGTDLDGVCGMLAESLDRVRYGSERIVLSEGLSEVRGLKTPQGGTRSTIGSPPAWIAATSLGAGWEPAPRRFWR